MTETRLLLSDSNATVALMTPFYATHPCGTCRANLGPDGVFVTDQQKWCRPCAVLLSGLLNSVLGGQN